MSVSKIRICKLEMNCRIILKKFRSSKILIRRSEKFGSLNQVIKKFLKNPTKILKIKNFLINSEKLWSLNISLSFIFHWTPMRCERVHH